MRRRIYFFISVIWILSAGPFAFGLELRFSAGSANYQFEGAGSSPTNLWESKPIYPREPYVELELRTRSDVDKPYLRSELEYLGGRRVQETPQAVVRRLETWVAYFGWGWRMPLGLSFEVGPMGVSQRHFLEDPGSTQKINRAITRLGNYFGAFYNHAFGPWELGAASAIGILGFPQRQSAVSEIEFTFDRIFSGGAWALGAKIKTGLLQLEKDSNNLETLGTTADAITFFRQGETDTKIYMLTARRAL